MSAGNDRIINAQLHEIKRLRQRVAGLEQTLRTVRAELRTLRPLRRLLERERTARWNQHRRAELWKHRALRK